MASENFARLMGDHLGSIPFPNTGDAALALQREILEAYGQLNREWLTRVQAEVALWSDLARKLTKAGSVPEALQAYAACLSQQMQMTAEDCQQLLNGYQKISQRVTKSLSRPIPTRKEGKSSKARRR